jgi:hypothetical protein
MATKDSEAVQKSLKVVKKEIQNLWDGMDYLANPMGGK